MKLISVNRRSLFEVSFIILLTYHKKRIHLVGQKQVYTGNTLTYCSTAFGWNLDEYYLCQIPLKLRQQFNHYHLHDFETRWNIYDSKARPDLEKFGNGVFTLKTPQIFSVHKNAYNRLQSPVILENFLENVFAHTSTAILKFFWFKERFQ